MGCTLRIFRPDPREKEPTMRTLSERLYRVAEGPANIREVMRELKSTLRNIPIRDNQRVVSEVWERYAPMEWQDNCPHYLLGAEEPLPSLPHVSMHDQDQALKIIGWLLANSQQATVALELLREASARQVAWEQALPAKAGALQGYDTIPAHTVEWNVESNLPKAHAEGTVWLDNMVRGLQLAPRKKAALQTPSIAKLKAIRSKARDLDGRLPVPVLARCYELLLTAATEGSLGPLDIQGLKNPYEPLLRLPKPIVYARMPFQSQADPKNQGRLDIRL